MFGALLGGIQAPVQAHYVYSLSGWVYHSVDCSITVKQLPNQTTHPGTVVCSVAPAGSLVRVWCANPAGYVFAGQAAVGTQTIVQTPPQFTVDQAERNGDGHGVDVQIYR